MKRKIRRIVDKQSPAPQPQFHVVLHKNKNRIQQQAQGMIKAQTITDHGPPLAYRGEARLLSILATARLGRMAPCSPFRSRAARNRICDREVV